MLDVLSLPMDPETNDAGAESVGAYLITLLREVIARGESFSGKRPFGNSGWLYELAPPLIKAGAVPGTVDIDGHVDGVDEAALECVLLNAVGNLHQQEQFEQ